MLKGESIFSEWHIIDLVFALLCTKIVLFWTVPPKYLLASLFLKIIMFVHFSPSVTHYFLQLFLWKRLHVFKARHPPGQPRFGDAPKWAKPRHEIHKCIRPTRETGVLRICFSTGGKAKGPPELWLSPIVCDTERIVCELICDYISSFRRACRFLDNRNRIVAFGNFTIHQDLGNTNITRCDS